MYIRIFKIIHVGFWAEDILWSLGIWSFFCGVCLLLYGKLYLGVRRFLLELVSFALSRFGDLWSLFNDR